MTASWNWNPLIGVLLAFTAWRYMDGVWMLWRQAGHGRGVTRAQVAAFWGGLAALFVAFISPIDALGEQSLSAHMVQHLLIVSLAAPFLAYGMPPVALAWSVPRGWRRPLARWWHRQGRLRAAWGVLTHPAAAWLLYLTALWGWHLPELYDAALRNDLIHLAEHATFLGTALLFWTRLPLHAVGRRGMLAALVALVTTAMHSSLLGLLLTFSSSVWYVEYRQAVSALEDQQAAGALMWGPGGIVYLLAILYLLARWFGQMEDT